jgi:hypothetical protein
MNTSTLHLGREWTVEHDQEVRVMNPVAVAQGAHAFLKKHPLTGR